tara:strand:+ start:1594 stop:1848 length:255 start_codon:yes stop_codon:yes gene_type:complete
MSRKKRIEFILLENIKDWEIEVIDNSFLHKGHNNFDGNQETHFKINLQNKSINKPNRLEIHRKINALLENEFLNGLHALEINIL